MPLPANPPSISAKSTKTQYFNKQTAMFPLFFSSPSFFFTFTLFPILLALPNPDPAIQTFLPSSSPPATIPAFPEQSDVAGCPLDLPLDLFHGVESACAVTKGKTVIPDSLRRTRCCPVLAAWLYSAYSATALGRAVRAPQTTSYDLPLLPDDSETCVDTLQKALNVRGIDLVRPNETCDVVYCYCGIRLHPMSCTEAFSVSSEGELVAHKSVKRLERDCLSKSSINGGGYGGLGGCSKCLNSLHLIKGNSTNTNKSEDRTSKMHNKDCELMGLTWLLAKNRSAYIHTVSAVLRAMMMSTDGSSGLKSCTLNSDGMPLAVDSSEMAESVSPNTLQPPLLLCIFSLCLLYGSLSSTFRHSLLHVAYFV